MELFRVILGKKVHIWPASVEVNFTNFEKETYFIKILRDEKVAQNSLPPAKIILFQHLGTFFSFQPICRVIGALFDEEILICLAISFPN